jgi:predicted PhzF superfamily epimerase YddE/YHI9
MRRDGRVEVRFGDDGTIWLGGHAVTCVEGTLTV